ncbi:unnamed protein product [Adineta steineri]|uniref:Innexin n=1 Tax=Adineta steineri TaxID=433720 RepID=A0A818RMU8_9BILA|nr:unnamed protein product [Adineta steineri]CAF0836011.1 unnamed protein product [Adineta steineri]CAF0899579.1 unnamed protein product [Adineta steineri]CAF3653730.1 unnamed protein product [Adineta steineri]CAF3674054.1 unnamed protein product [Adineta steineri]
MEWASNFISEIYKYLKYRDDTSIDRLNRLYTVALLTAFVTLITSQQYVVGGRIICWAPKEFTDPHITYAHDICWLGQSNYYVSENFTILHNPSSPRIYPFSIYPWFPLVLISMIVGFIAPYLLIWHGLSTRSGININRLTKLNNQEQLTHNIHYILSKKYSIKNNGKYYVISIYLITKFFYIINLITQILFINKILNGYYFHMNLKEIFQILSVKHNMWSSTSTPYFPIETMCDFMVRMLGHNNNWYTIQCILPFNLFTKRIFALLILWFNILLILNLIDFIIVWLWHRIWLSSRRYEYIIRLFHLYELYLYDKSKSQSIMLATSNQALRREFVQKYLGLDGYLLLKFLHSNSTDMNMSYLVAHLFKEFLQMEQRQPKKYTKHDKNTDT